jgi:8-oxo-dGTP diphosphatase
VSKSVGAILYIKNKYLVQKRSKKKNIYFPNMYGLFGGGLNLNEKFLNGIHREIYEELDLKLNLKKIKNFLTISINSRHFKKSRSRKYYAIKINNKQITSIKLKEGQSFHFLGINQIKKLNFVPWDLSAILYFHNYILKKKSVKPRHI